jgi:hypothetical protein
MHILGLGLVFLNSPDAAFDLLDKRGSIYSDKPALVMAGELCVFFGLCQCNHLSYFVPIDAAAKTW